MQLEPEGKLQNKTYSAYAQIKSTGDSSYDRCKIEWIWARANLIFFHLTKHATHNYFLNFGLQ